MGVRLAGVLVVVTAAALALPTLAGAGPFRSPSGNIGCYIDAAWGARCDIRVRSWPTPKRPPSCDLDFGQGVQVGRRGRATFVCAGDTALGAGPRLAYGSSLRQGDFRCTSRSSGMRCENIRTRHGFVLSRQSVRRY